MAWYSSAETWSAIAAAVAIWLSQVRPVRFWFKSSKLEVAVQSQAALRATVTGPLFQVYVSVENTGGKKVRIHRLSLAVKRDGQDVLRVDGSGYFESPSSPSAVIFRPFDLPPEQTWAHNVNFYPLPSREEDRAFRKEKAALLAAFNQQARSRPEGDTTPVIAPPDLYALLNARFERGFVWTQGEYQASILALDKDGRALAEGRYRFVLFESDRDELKAAGSRILVGEGVVFDPKEPITLVVPLALDNTS